MSYIPEDIIQEVRQKADIVSIINDYVKLSKRGTNYIASCPFHEDRNPSFSVSATKQIYKCFSCGRGGNVFGFLQEIEGISFVEAVRKTAELSNLALDERFFNQPTDIKHQKQHLMLDLHQKVADFYHYYLMSTVAGEEAYHYLIQRDLSVETLKTYYLGLAPEQPNVLLQFMAEAGYVKETLIQSGIFYETERGELVDRFKGRIIFPLRNAKGQIIAFSGRIFSQSHDNDRKLAKYLNSPETDIFHKSQLVFNLDIARPTIRQTDQVLICEGYMDVIALHQAGFKNAVATMGTSLTEQHLGQLAKLAQEFVFIFDGDEAGQKATMRALELAQKLPNQRLKIVIIPNRLDPDEWIKQKGKDAFQQLVNQATSSYDFYQYAYKQQYDLSDRQQLAKYIELMIQHIASLTSPIERELRVNELAQMYHLSESLLLEQLAQKLQNYSKTTPSVKSDATQMTTQNHQSDEQIGFKIISKRALQSEKQLISSLIFHEEAWLYLNQLTTPLLLFHSTSQEALFQLQQFYYDRGASVPLTNIVNFAQNPQVNHFFTTLLWESEPTQYSDDLMHDCIHVIEQEFTLLQIQELRDKIKQLEKENRFNEVNELMLQIIQLNRQLKNNTH